MNNVFLIIFSVFGYVLIGFILKKLKFISTNYEKLLTKLSFNFLLPIALINNFWLITFPDIFILKLLISFFGSGIIIFIISFTLGKYIYKFKIDDSALLGLGACFGNSVALGIPLMYSVLGEKDAMPYMILVLFHGIIHFTYTTLIIESYRNRDRSNIKKIIFTIIGLAQNIILAGMFIGLALNYFNINYDQNIKNILQPISKIALPAVLFSMGMSLANFQIASNIKLSIILTLFKNFLHPLIAFIFAQYIFSLSPLLVFIITIAAALPSGTQTYYFSFRYNSLQNIISTNIVISTFTSFFTLTLLLIFFGY